MVMSGGLPRYTTPVPPPWLLLISALPEGSDIEFLRGSGAQEERLLGDIDEVVPGEIVPEGRAVLRYKPGGEPEGRGEELGVPGFTSPGVRGLLGEMLETLKLIC